MSWMTGIIHELMTFILDTCRLYHTSGKLWKKQSAITVKCKIINKNNNSGKRRPWESDPNPLGNCFLLDPLPIGISDGLLGGKYKPHPGMEGNSFHFLMNLSRYTRNSSRRHWKFFLKLFNSLLSLNVHVFSANTKHERYF